MANLLRTNLYSLKNVPALFQKIQEGTAPPKFTIQHLKENFGLGSSHDRALIPVLKGLGFLSDDGTPTTRYHDYRNKAKAKSVLGEAIKEAYAELFHISESPSEKDRDAIEGKFKTTFNVKDDVAGRMAGTFFAILKLADISSESKQVPVHTQDEQNDADETAKPAVMPIKQTRHSLGGLHYTIEIHLPPTKDIEVYNAIFKSLKEHLID